MSSASSNDIPELSLLLPPDDPLLNECAELTREIANISGVEVHDILNAENPPSIMVGREEFKPLNDMNNLFHSLEEEDKENFTPAVNPTDSYISLNIKQAPIKKIKSKKLTTKTKTTSSTPIVVIETRKRPRESCGESSRIPFKKRRLTYSLAASPATSATIHKVENVQPEPSKSPTKSPSIVLSSSNSSGKSMSATEAIKISGISPISPPHNIQGKHAMLTSEDETPACPNNTKVDCAPSSQTFSLKVQKVIKKLRPISRNRMVLRSSAKSTTKKTTTNRSTLTSNLEDLAIVTSALEEAVMSYSRFSYNQSKEDAAEDSNFLLCSYREVLKTVRMLFKVGRLLRGKTNMLAFKN